MELNIEGYNYEDLENLIDVTWGTTNGELLLEEDQLVVVGADGAGVYWLQIENLENGCIGETSVEYFEPSFEVQVPELVLLTCENPTALISAVVQNDLENYLFSWTSEASNVEGIGLNTFSMAEASVIDLTVTYGDCNVSEQILVEQSPNYSIDLSSLDAPNVFTPNLDESNNLFYPVLKDNLSFDVISALENYSLTIYSRWGNELFTTNSGGWDGKVNGEVVEDGVYYYVITFNSVCGDQTDGELTGTVTLIN